MVSVFICYSSEDKLFVRRLAKYLKSHGLNVWIDEISLMIGEPIIERISKVIDKVDYVLAVISGHSVNSSWVQKELNIAMSREITNKQIIVLPILIDKCNVPVFLKDKLYLDLTNIQDYRRQLLKLLQTVGKRKEIIVRSTPEGVRLIGSNTIISPIEHNALIKRFFEHLDNISKNPTKYIKRAGWRGKILDSCWKACKRTYLYEPSLEELKELETDLSRKYDLFFRYIDKICFDIDRKSIKKYA